MKTVLTTRAHTVPASGHTAIHKLSRSTIRGYVGPGSPAAGAGAASGALPPGVVGRAATVESPRPPRCPERQPTEDRQEERERGRGYELVAIHQRPPRRDNSCHKPYSARENRHACATGHGHTVQHTGLGLSSVAAATGRRRTGGFGSNPLRRHNPSRH